MDFPANCTDAKAVHLFCDIPLSGPERPLDSEVLLLQRNHDVVRPCFPVRDRPQHVLLHYVHGGHACYGSSRGASSVEL